MTSCVGSAPSSHDGADRSGYDANVTGPAYAPPEGLPSFKRPPLTEAVIGVEFRPLAGLGAVNMVNLYREWSEVYPRSEERPALPPSFGPGGEPVQFFRNDGVMPLRLWMVNGDETGLISIQSDRLFHNWRARPGGSEYPRYTVMREEFAKRWEEFSRFVAVKDLGEIVPSYIEVSFINQYEVASGASDFGVTFASAAGPDIPGQPAAFQAQSTRSVDVDGAGSGFLTISLGWPLDSVPGTAQLAVSTRVAATVGSSIDEVLGALDHVHDVGVQGFAAVTTEAQHLTWGIR